jgi:hypothetical protein
MHNYQRKFKAWKVYICASVRKGQFAEVPYICHANNLVRPSKGVLIFEGV